MKKKLEKFTFTLMLLTSINACAASSPMEKQITVFKSSGDKQCLHVGKTLEQSRQQLTDKGVMADEGYCAVRTDMAYPAVCGGGTPDIHVFSIDASQEQLAAEAGFKPVDKITFKPAKCRTTSPAERTDI